jgi:hypothetical protein
MRRVTQLNAAQMNYTATELECAAVVWTIKEFDYILRDRPFKVVNAHKATEWLPVKNTPNKRLMRAFIYLSEFGTSTSVMRRTSQVYPTCTMGID